ncbi:MAG: hypothetical protein AB8G22_03820, partial [Saprospiraceae bacterium]
SEIDDVTQIEADAAGSVFCLNFASTPVTGHTTTITINATPTVSVADVAVCTENAATIVATPAGGDGSYTYAWTVPATATNPGNNASFSTMVAGTYTVTVTDGNDCTDTDDGLVSFDSDLCCPTDLATSTAPAVQVTNSVCLTSPGKSSNGGYFTAPTTACPDGSTLEYSTNNSTWETTLPTYNQTTEMTVYTRCNCDGDTDVSSMTSQVTTVPGPCADPCASDNPYNITVDDDLYVMDFVNIFSGSGETWTLSAINEGTTLYTNDPPNTITVGTAIPELGSSSEYVFQYWTLAGADYGYSVSNSAFALSLTSTTCVPCSISALTIDESNISECQEGAISSTFSADVTVTFANAPSTGTLDLT